MFILHKKIYYAEYIETASDLNMEIKSRIRDDEKYYAVDMGFRTIKREFGAYDRITDASPKYVLSRQNRHKPKRNHSYEHYRFSSTQKRLNYHINRGAKHTKSELIEFGFCIVSGPEGSRTPVRKPIHCSISHHSQLFDIPSVRRRLTGCGL